MILVQLLLQIVTTCLGLEYKLALFTRSWTLHPVAHRDNKLLFSEEVI